MRYIITTTGTSLTEGMQQAVYKAFEKIENSIDAGKEEAVLKINLKVSKNEHKAEASIPIGKHIIRAEAKAEDLYDAIKQSAKLMMSNIRKNKEKMLQIWHDPVRFSFEEKESDVDISEEKIEIAKEKKIELDMMTPEEACLQLEMIGHDFYMFLNSETDTVSAAYKREDGRYGIIVTI